MNLPASQLKQAIQLLNNDDIIAIPTETVYGLAGNAYSEKAVSKIFELKKRPFFNPLIVHIRSVSFLENVAMDIPPKAIKLAETFFPGPLTLVLKKKPVIPAMVTAGKPTVGVRVPNHPLTLSLLEQIDYPLAAPSANPFTSISPTSAAHVSMYFKDKLPLVVDGGTCKSGIESTIIGFENNKAILYRYGSVSVEEIESVIGKLAIINSNENAPQAPGMLAKHYAPVSKIILTDNVDAVIEQNADKKIGLLLFDKINTHTNIFTQEILSPKSCLKEAASNLYAALHRLDNGMPDLIIAEKFPAVGLGKSINDRLVRATK